MYAKKETDKYRKLVWILGIVVAVLVLFLIFLFVLRPATMNFVGDKQMEGVNIAIASIIQSVYVNGYVDIPISEDQSLTLFPLESIVQTVQNQGYLEIPISEEQSLILVPVSSEVFSSE